MKYLKRQEGMVLPLVIGLVALVVVVVGVAVWQSQKAKTKADQTAVSPSPSTVAQASSSPSHTASPVQTDQDLILALLKAHYSKNGQTPSAGTKYLLCKLEAGYATVLDQPNGAGGGDLLLKKSQGNWSIAYEGQNLDETTATQLGFPSGFGNACSSSSPVLYTY
jgi:hypothetical protein